MLKQKPELIRQRLALHERSDNQLQLVSSHLINFSSNDYLGLACHSEVKRAFIKAVERFGVGGSASMMLSGYYHAHQELEECMADFLNRDRALLFNSGYLANVAVMSVLAKRNGTVVADKFCHASILDGIQLSRAKCMRFHHQDMRSLAMLCESAQTGDVIVSESVFSMEGDITNVKTLSDIAMQKQMLLVIDDAHGAGVLGENGKGICEHQRLTQEEVPLLVVPLGKAYASMGAIVSGSSDLIESLLQFSKTYCYTTALPPAIASAAVMSLQISQQESWRREKLSSLIHFFNQKARERSLKLISDDVTPIRSILIGDNALVMRLKSLLLEAGFLISAIRPPTVPEGSARIRISLNCNHEEVEIERLLDIITPYVNS